MRKRLLTLGVILLVLVLPFTFGACTKGGTGADTGGAEVDNSQETLNIIPFSERKFLYTNGLQYDMKQSNTKVEGIDIEKSYPVISGMKNSDIQKKINNEILSNLELYRSELETKVKAEGHKITREDVNGYVTYNYNNVIFVQYYTGIEIGNGNRPKELMKAFGYDLNTGNHLTLSDLFKKGSSYEKIINEYISLDIIKENLDDPDSGYITGPFKGIAKDQSFYLDLYGLNILINEKNPEFLTNKQNITIQIPMKVIGPELAIFDRYFQNQDSLFNKKGQKKPLANPIEYKVKSRTLESVDKYDINIEEGEFVNVKNEDVKKRLDDFAKNTLDIVGFKARAAANPEKYYGSLSHRVSVIMNSGGYLSVLVLDSQFEKGKGQEKRKPLNYDLDKNKVMKLKDFFVPGYDYKTALGKILSTKEYSNYGNYIFKTSDINKLSEDIFYFGDQGLSIYLALPNREEDQNYFHIPYEKIGYENIVMYK